MFQGVEEQPRELLRLHEGQVPEAQEKAPHQSKHYVTTNYGYYFILKICQQLFHTFTQLSYTILKCLNDA